MGPSCIYATLPSHHFSCEYYSRPLRSTISSNRSPCHNKQVSEPSFDSPSDFAVFFVASAVCDLSCLSTPSIWLQVDRRPSTRSINSPPRIVSVCGASRCGLVQQGLFKALEGKEKLASTLSDEQKDEIMEKAHSAILLSLGDEVLREVASEKTAPALWSKLETKYMTKSLTNLSTSSKDSTP
ncbi:Unknown protein [Striga hermonthica]|uniref:Retrovirus-related Pol polyprotein from transposon TNT 1-94 n=1 Tax=Striga hermonthica TaxID=68872 RepID=A0A9N7R2F6_STRHE|nr:Unknown protein [Striga hermonthica]